MLSVRWIPLLALFLLLGCQPEPTPVPPVEEAPPAPERLRVILDTDANNELDDQHAIAYLLLNEATFDIAGITVNETRSGGDIDAHVQEAARVVQLLNKTDEVGVYPGASGAFEEIQPTLAQETYDGAEAVAFIIETARAATPDDPLVLLPVGKLTNIALALDKAPDIADRVRIVWLGSNYPEPGEYNQVNDEASLRYLLDAEVPFEIALVRYGEPSGTDAVRITPEEVDLHLSGHGPQATTTITGRHGGTFSTFGDYSVNLFSHIDLHGDPPSRALFDMAAVAIVKDPTWATATSIPAPQLNADGTWTDQPDNPRTIILWENFDAPAILQDFYQVLQAETPSAE